MSKPGFIATVQVVISYPGCENDAPEDWFSALLSENPEVADWGYLRISDGVFGYDYPRPVEIADDYSEGDLINVQQQEGE